jgi:hypothetical protein
MIGISVNQNVYNRKFAKTLCMCINPISVGIQVAGEGKNCLEFQSKPRSNDVVLTSPASPGPQLGTLPTDKKGLT